MALLVHQSAVAPPRRRLPFVPAQLLVLGAAVAVYFGVRHLSEGVEEVARRNADLLIRLEHGVGLFLERDLQRWALSFDGVLPAANTVYIWAHWPVIATVFVWLAWRRRSVFPIYRDALLLSGLVGMLVVAAFPVAPPRLMDLGFVDTVTTHSESYRVLQPPSFTNQYAAMPSFHVGWDLLVGIALVREASRRWMRVLGAALPVLMLLSVVVTGNHYFVDAAVGDAIVLGALALVTRIRWGRRTPPILEPS